MCLLYEEMFCVFLSMHNIPNFTHNIIIIRNIYRLYIFIYYILYKSSKTYFDNISITILKYHHATYFSRGITYSIPHVYVLRRVCNGSNINSMR